MIVALELQYSIHDHTTIKSISSLIETDIALREAKIKCDITTKLLTEYHGMLLKIFKALQIFLEKLV